MMTIERFKSLACIGLLFILTALFYAEVVFTDRTFAARDNYMFYNPRRAFAAESLRTGELPLWNPYVACGVPFQANLQSAVFYPLSAVYYLMPFQIGFKYFIVLHYFLGGAFMFALMRAWGSRRPASMLSAVVFAFGGYLVSINDNVAFLTAGVWLPLVLLCHHHALRTGAYFYSLLAGLVIALQIFSGDASFYLLSTLMCTAVYTLLWRRTRGGSQGAIPRGSLRPWGLLAAGWAAGALLAAVQLVPFAGLAMQSTRYPGLSYEMVTKWSAHPLEMLQLLVPYVFGSSVPETRWFGQWWLDTPYVGVFPLLCAGLYLLRVRDRLKLYLACLTVLSLFLCLGRYNPCFAAVYRVLPGAGMLLFPVKFLFLAAFSLAVMAGRGLAGLEDLCGGAQPLKRWAALPAVLLVLVTAALAAGAVFNDALYGLFRRVYPQTEYMQGLLDQSFENIFSGASVLAILLAGFLALLWALERKKVTALTGMCLVIAVSFLDLRLAGKPDDPTVPESIFNEPGPIVNFLRQDRSIYRIYSLARFASNYGFMHSAYVPFERVYRIVAEAQQANVNMHYRIQSAEEYAALLRRDYYDVFSRVEQSLKDRSPAGQPAAAAYGRKILSLLNVKYILSPFALEGYGFSLVREGPIKVYENPGVLPRAFFAPQLVVVRDSAQVLARMKDPGFSPGDTACITREAFQKIEAGLAGRPAEAGLQNGALRIVEYRAGRVTLAARAGRRALMVLADSYDPGWKARLDGREVPVVRVNHIQRGVMVPEGVHEIIFTYRPSTFSAGALISLLAAAAVGLGLVLMRKRSGLYSFPTVKKKDGSL